MTSMQLLLETERLALRRFAAADARHLHALDNDPEVMRYINGGLPVALEVVEAELLPTFLEYDERRPTLGFLAAVDRADGAFLGWVSLRPTRGDAGELELGYRFRRAAWGRGYATEAAGALIARAFADPAVRRIFATTYEQNVASRRVMEKLGLTLRRTFRPTSEELAASDTSIRGNGDPWPGNDVEYALDRADYEACRS
jgi:RimJ/RimL family protein N-acetyltransferase